MSILMTPPDCDLQDFPFMPLHVARLRDSDLAATADPEACWYAVLLWAASWHQIPAASLPDDDAVLARLCGLGRDLRTFRKHKLASLHGFEKGSDGRLYHPVVAEQAIIAWESKLQQRWRTECARIKKHNQRHGTAISSPTFEEFTASGLSSVPLPVPRDKEGTGSECPSGKPLQETGTETGIIIEEEEEARAGEDDWVDGIANRIAKAGGINHSPDRPERFGQNIMLVRDWVQLGATEEEMIAVARERCANHDAPIFTFRFLDAAIRQTVARRENLEHGTEHLAIRRSAGNYGSGFRDPVLADIAGKPHS